MYNTCLLLIECFAVATVDLMVVGGSDAVCSGASVTLHCTLTGDILTWSKKDGDINLVRSLHTTSISDTYQWQLEELDEYRLKSSITFAVGSNFTINCTNFAGGSSSVTLFIEGIIIIHA